MIDETFDSRAILRRQRRLQQFSGWRSIELDSRKQYGYAVSINASHGCRQTSGAALGIVEIHCRRHE